MAVQVSRWDRLKDMSGVIRGILLPDPADLTAFGSQGCPWPAAGTFGMPGDELRPFLGRTRPDDTEAMNDVGPAP